MNLNYCLVALGILAIAVYAYYRNESYNALYNSIAAPINSVNFQIDPMPIIAPRSEYSFPQQGSVKGRSWNTLSKGLKTAPTKVINTNYLAFPEQRKNICSAHNGAIAPRAPQDCPDSSFSYMTDLSKWIPDAKHGGCIQLGNISWPNCWSDAEGKYHPWEAKLKVTNLN